MIEEHIVTMRRPEIKSSKIILFKKNLERKPQTKAGLLATFRPRRNSKFIFTQLMNVLNHIETYTFLYKMFGLLGRDD